MNYLVTGAAGFIGGAVAEKLIKDGHSVTTIDNLSTGYSEHIPHGVEFIEGSTADEKVIALLENREFDAIMHIAGQSSGEVSFENPIYDLQTNAQSTVMLLDLARRIKCKKFVYASTMSVYGDHNPPECAEDAELVPKSFYAVGKVASEHYMRIFSEQFGITCTALRLFNTYGPGQNMKNLKQGMVSIYLAMAINNHRIIVKGSKDRFRDFVYIDDVVDAFVRSLEIKTGYNLFNVCTCVATRVENVVERIREELNFPIEVEYIEGTPGDQFGILGNNDRIKDIIGWEPKYSFANGLKKMVKWAKDING